MSFASVAFSTSIVIGVERTSHVCKVFSLDKFIVATSNFSIRKYKWKWQKKNSQCWQGKRYKLIVEYKFCGSFIKIKIELYYAVYREVAVC